LRPETCSSFPGWSHFGPGCLPTLHRSDSTKGLGGVRLHVIPDGFQRIRYFGFLANRYRAEKLALCLQFLQMPPPTATAELKKDYKDHYEALTGISLKTCPLRRCGTMVVIETFECLQ
jgi:hypothetical protein